MGLAIARKDKIAASVVVEGGTDTNVQSAIDNLTPGRTWKEKVVCVGDFTLADSIKLPSYTILEVIGKFTAQDSFPTLPGGIIENDDPIGGNTDIEIIGAEIDGNYANQSNTLSGVWMKNVDGLYLYDIKSNNNYNHGFYINGVSNFIVLVCSGDSNGDDGLTAIKPTTTAGVINGGAFTNGRGVTGASCGIEIEDGANNITITSVYTKGNPSFGIQAVIDSTNSSPPRNITANGCISEGDGSGFGCVSTYSTANSGAITESSGTYTVPTTANPNNLVVGDWVNIPDSDNADLNGEHQITAVTDGTYDFEDAAGLGGTTSTHGTTYALISDVSFNGCHASGSTTQGAKIQQSYNCNINGGSLANGGTIGVNFIDAIGGSMNGVPISNFGTIGISLSESKGVAITGGGVSNTGSSGMAVTSNCDNVTINGVPVRNCSNLVANQFAISISASDNTSILNCPLVDDRNTKKMRGIKIFSGSLKTKARNNTLDTATQAGKMIVDQDASSIIRGNVGHDTEISGLKSAGTSPLAFNHGFKFNSTDTAPSYVNVSPAGAGVTDYNVTVTATQIIITYSGSDTDWWYEARLGADN